MSELRRKEENLILAAVSRLSEGEGERSCKANESRKSGQDGELGH
jgi:hypothetical protein